MPLSQTESAKDSGHYPTDFSRKAHVYYGDVTLHEYLERTTWHSGQHVRHEVSLFSDAPFFNFSRIVPIRDSVRPSDNRKEFHPCVPAWS